MVVSLLLKIIEKYPLNHKGVKVQFVTHKRGSFWADEIYDGAVHIIPVADNGEDLWYRSIYINCSSLKDWEMRSAFHELVGRYNKSNWEKGELFTPIKIEGNYCIIK